MTLTSRPWLGLDTATDTPGVALVDGAAVLFETAWRTRRGHSREAAARVWGALDSLGLEARDLAGVAVAIGPGSYTSLRVGLALAKGLAFGAGLPVAGVPTLDAVAAPLSSPEVDRRHTLWAVLAAGRSRVVVAAYPPEGPWPSPVDLEPAPFEPALARASPGDWIAGELEETQRRLAAESGLRVASPAAGLRRAAWIAQLGASRGGAARSPAELAALEPVYPLPAGA